MAGGDGDDNDEDGGKGEGRGEGLEREGSFREPPLSQVHCRRRVLVSSFLYWLNRSDNSLLSFLMSCMPFSDMTEIDI